MTETERTLSLLHDRVSAGDMGAIAELELRFGEPLRRIIRRRQRGASPENRCKAFGRDCIPNAESHGTLAPVLRELARAVARPSVADTIARCRVPTVRM